MDAYGNRVYLDDDERFDDFYVVRGSVCGSFYMLRLNRRSVRSVTFLMASVGLNDDTKSKLQTTRETKTTTTKTTLLQRHMYISRERVSVCVCVCGWTGGGMDGYFYAVNMCVCVFVRVGKASHSSI